MSNKRFPILRRTNGQAERQAMEGCPESVPWEAIEPHRASARENHFQSLETLASRGGLSPVEMYLVFHGLSWVNPPPVSLRDAVEFVRGIEKGAT
jgi:hypothetical protein